MKIAKMSDGKPEIYPAIQGEGKTIGKPVVFVRLFLCNLHCKFCDTAYTWFFENSPFKHDWDEESEQCYLEMSPEEVADYIMLIAKGACRVVFTGGEPLLQQKEIKEVIDNLPDWAIEIETNGTILFQKDVLELVNQINCSPKMANSGNDLDMRFKYDVLKQINEADGIFKFVVGSVNDLEEIKKLTHQIHIPNEQIYLMPEGVDTEKIIKGTKEVADICLEHGYNLSTRLQIILFGNKRAI